MIPLRLPSVLWSQLMYFMGRMTYTHAHLLTSACKGLCTSPEVVKLLSVVVNTDLWPGDERCCIPAWLRSSHRVAVVANYATTVELAAPIRNLPRLHTLEVDVLYALPAAGGTGHMESADMTALTALLAQRCATLQRLTLSECCALTDDALVALVNGCPELRHLSVHSCTVNYRSDAAGVAIGARCPKLLSVDLSWCYQEAIGDHTFVAIAEGCPELQSLTMRECCQESITDATFVAVANGCPNLQSLIMQGCNQCTITDAALVAIANGCTKLRALDISFCDQETISDVALAMIAESCTNLQSLNFVGCNQRTITDATFGALARLPNLRRCVHQPDE